MNIFRDQVNDLVVRRNKKDEVIKYQIEPYNSDEVDSNKNRNKSHMSRLDYE